MPGVAGAAAAFVSGSTRSTGRQPATFDEIGRTNPVDACVEQRRGARAAGGVQASRRCAPRPSATARSPSRSTPIPSRRRGELLVRVRAAGLNGADMLQLKGGYPAPPGSPPDIPGLELAGEVVATGRGVTRFEPGDRVMAVVGGGGQARARGRARARRDAGARRARLDRRGRRARGVHDRPRRALHAGRADGRRARARARRGGRRRHGGGAARDDGRRARDRDRARPGRARADRRARRQRDRARGLRGARPVRRRARARRRAEPARATSRRSPSAGASASSASARARRSSSTCSR